VDSVEVDVSALVKVLQDYGHRIDNFEPIAAQVAEILVTGVEDLVETEGGAAWPALAQTTLDRRRHGGKGAKMLQDTGLMIGGLVPFHDSDHAAAATSASYAGFHLEGTGAMPARNFFDLFENDQVMGEIIELITMEILG
jgi:phage gpG-like protein